MIKLMRKYRDLPMDVADAALVRVAERERWRQIFDRRDFQIYRPFSNRTFRDTSGAIVNGESTRVLEPLAG